MELLVTEKEILARFSLDDLAQLVQIVDVELPTEDVGVHLITEFLDLLELSIREVVFGGVVLGNEEHSVVLLPVILKV